MARYFSFPSVEKMWEAEIKIGESEIAFELMGFNVAMVAANITTSNEEEEETFKRLSTEVQGPGFFIIIAGNSAADFAYKKRVLQHIVSDCRRQVFNINRRSQDRRDSVVPVRQNFCLDSGNVPSGWHVQLDTRDGQRDLTIKWAIGAGKAKEPLIAKGLIVDDGGAFFGWGVEQGHLGKTEIFCNSILRIR